MKFDEQFPSLTTYLHNWHFETFNKIVFDESKTSKDFDRVTDDALFFMKKGVQEHCLDKQKVRDVINGMTITKDLFKKLSEEEANKFWREDLKRELGL